MKIGFINETASGSNVENRVAITPEIALKYAKSTLKNKFEVYVEKGAGVKSFYNDKDYENAGAKVVSRSEALSCDFVCFLKTPDDKTISSLKSGQTVLGLLNSFSDLSISSKFEKKGVRAIDLNKLPRQLSVAQSMDAMTSQASIAGYEAVLLAAKEFPAFLPMLTTAAGTVKPASVLILGAGIAGLQAIGTAKRLGAVVTAFDVRPAAAEEIASLGAKFLDLSKYGAAEVAAALSQGQGEGGYARKLTDSELSLQKKATDAAVADFDIVITTAQVPGAKPPQFVSAAGVKGMKQGSVIVDISASALGSNVEGAKPGQTVEVGGVKIIGAPNLASSAPKSASNLLARNFCDVALHFASQDEKMAENQSATSGEFADELGCMVIAPAEKTQNSKKPTIQKETKSNENKTTQGEK